ncbi:hypothetical protein K2173_016754 [Erythroxylum novogranatense]|uniref:Bromo domain-containing protein n=1 Tax=Erythroxylum novogranatense TaxID=1862640 RepID=A0AAV8SHI7_9ROSI|nr:hypothetical protein K2173_016754 [Erythroxylum novogranatense]
MERQEGIITTSTGRRRSARISELEEKARLLALEKKAKAKALANTNKNSNNKPKSTNKRGNKRKSLHDVEGDSSRAANISTRLDQPTSGLSPQKWNQTLELILDILQRRDTHDIFAQAINPDVVYGYYGIVKEPMDFGTMRAKLWEGSYTSLELFERDVFLVCNNAMTFCSPATLFHVEARAISELAKQLFHILRTEPEKFESEYLGTRRRSDKRPRPESSDGHTSSKHPKQWDASSPAFTASGNLPSSIPSSGPNEGNASETERRGTYRPQSSYVDEDQLSFASAVNAQKQLQFNPDAGIGYRESLMRFAKDLGPIAQMVANRKLAQLPTQPSSFGVDQPSSTLQLGGVHHQQLRGHQMPSSFFSPSSPSVSVARFRGKVAEDQSCWAPTTNVSAAERSTTSTSDYMDVACASSQNVGGSKDSMDDLIWTIMQLGDIQNMCAQAPSGSYYPLTGTDDVYTAQPQLSHHHHQFSSEVQVQPPWPATNDSLDETKWLPAQTRTEEVLYFTPKMQGTSSSFFNTLDSQGPSSNATNYGQWSQQQAPWSLEAICSPPLPPVMQAQEQMMTTPWDLQEHNITLVGLQQWQERPLFDQSPGMSFSAQQEAQLQLQLQPQPQPQPQPQGVLGGAAETTFTSRPPHPSSSSGRGTQQQPDLNLQL